MNNNILNKGFTLYSLKHQYSLKGIVAIREYLALAYSENENTIERPIKFVYNENTNEYKISTFSNNDKIYDEFFSLGEVTTSDELDNIIDRLPFLVKEIDLKELHTYE